MNRTSTHLRLATWLCLLFTLVLTPPCARAQEFEFHPPPSPGDASTPAVMRDLAIRLLPVYSNPDTDRYLTNLAALQLVSGDYVAAYDTRQMLQNRQRSTDLGRPVDKAVLYDIYARARAIESGDKVQFATAFTQAFKEIVPRLNDRDAHAVSVWLATPRAVFQDALQKAFDQHRDSGSITFQEAVDLIWTYLSFDAYRNFSPLVEELGAQDDSRRYVTDDSVVIGTRAGVRIHAVVVRPAGASAPLPALLEFTLHIVPNDAKAAAAHGYAGVVAYTRGKTARGAGPVIPFDHDGEDARAVIAWIARQPWSDGRVGMIGDGYSGFTAWAAAKRRPPALKAIATSSTMAPGIDFPMTGNIFRNTAYRWSAVNTLRVDQEPVDNDDATWSARDQAWYKSGKSMRAFAHLVGKPDAIVENWLSHPSFDRYWQHRNPDAKQLAAIDIPVLTITGYYANGEAGALRIFSEHLRNQADADHTLLMGPYDGHMIAGEAPAVLRGYTLDTAARIDLRELRYQWFDSVFKNAPRPAILKDRVNVQLMGSNEWRHSPSLAALGNGRLRFYLDAGSSPDSKNLLSPQLKSALASVTQTVDFADRSDAGWTPPLLLTGNGLPPVRDGVTYVSEPLEQPVEFDGQLAGRLDFRLNRQDMDLSITLYEQSPNGQYLQLCEPYEIRASYLQDRAHRMLLRAGERQQLAFTSERFTSRRMQAGSRLVMVLAVNKRPDQQINYGSGKAVSDETVADAKPALKVLWYTSSYIDVPVRK